MSKIRKVSLTIGVLIVLSICVGLMSIVPSVDVPEYLSEAYPNRIQVLIAALSQIAMSLIYVAISVLLFAVIKKYDEPSAFGYLCLRTISQVFNLLGSLVLVLLLALSREFMETASTNSASIKALGIVLKSGRDYLNHVLMIVMTSISGIILFILTLRKKLLPEWLSIFGLIGSAVSIVASILVLFDIIEVITPIYMMLNLPLAIQDLTFAVWLMTKGFSESTIPMAPTKA
jgi:hypothetical protein